MDVLHDNAENNTLLKRDTVFAHLNFRLESGTMKLLSSGDTPSNTGSDHYTFFLSSSCCGGEAVHDTLFLLYPCCRGEGSHSSLRSTATVVIFVYISLSVLLAFSLHFSSSCVFLSVSVQTILPS